jgi:hypothetical protein
MKLVLPDNSELELPDGATGLDAAQAIGPKLAEQAVLVRVDGRVQDVRTTPMRSRCCVTRRRICSLRRLPSSIQG